MCDVPSIAVFCKETLECLPGMVSRYFFITFVIIRVAPVVTGIILHCRFHVRFISMRPLAFYFIFSASFCMTFLSTGAAISISMHVFPSLFLIAI